MLFLDTSLTQELFDLAAQGQDNPGFKELHLTYKVLRKAFLLRLGPKSILLSDRGTLD
jgi:hypothetical protein